MKPRRYTPEEIRFLRDNITGRHYAELTDMFNRRFRCAVSMRKIQKLAFYYNLRTGFGICIKNKSAIGTRRINSKGYAMVKVADPDVWKLKHQLVWEKANGPIPDGHVIIFADRNKSNFALKNLLPVTHAELAMMNHQRLFYDDRDATKAGRTIAKLLLLIADREREAGKRRKKREHKIRRNRRNGRTEDSEKGGRRVQPDPSKKKDPA
jgi:hypothetical protein